MATGALAGAVGAGVSAIAGLGSAAGNAASTADTNRMNLQIARENNAFNERMMDKQMNYNTEMYERQLADTLAYSDPSYQRQRLDNAGLNSALIMSGGSSLGSVSSTPSVNGVSAPSAQGVTMQPTDYSAVAQAMASAVGFYQQAQMNKADISLKQAQTKQVQIDNDTRARENLARLNKLISEADDARSRAFIGRISARFAETLKQNEVNQSIANLQETNERIRNLCLSNTMMDLNLQQYPEQLRLELGVLAADLRIKFNQGTLTERQALHELAKIQQTYADIKLTNELSRSAAANASVDEATKGYRIEISKETMWRAIYNSGSDNLFQLGQRAVSSFSDFWRNLGKKIGVYD